MESLTLYANAKLNLALDIIGTREDGYHLMDMVMQSVNLSDVVEIIKDQGGFSITSNSRFLPTDRRNSAYKAAEALAKAAGVPMFDCRIDIKKNIPSQAGLGGGTADAAAVLYGLNRLYKLGLTRDELLEIAPSIGADVPFCLLGGAARVGGIGDELSPLPPLRSSRFVIAMPWRGSSTRRAFELFDQSTCSVRPDVGAMADAVALDDTAAVAGLCGNVFQPLVSSGEMLELMEGMRQCGALAACVTGSGSAMYGVFADGRKAQDCRKKLRNKTRRCFVASPCAVGISVKTE